MAQLVFDGTGLYNLVLEIPHATVKAAQLQQFLVYTPLDYLTVIQVQDFVLGFLPLLAVGYTEDGVLGELF